MNADIISNGILLAIAKVAFGIVVVVLAASLLESFMGFATNPVAWFKDKFHKSNS